MTGRNAILVLIVIAAAVAAVFLTNSLFSRPDTAADGSGDTRILGAGGEDYDKTVVGLNDQSVKIDKTVRDLGAPTQHKAEGVDDQRIIGKPGSPAKNNEAEGLTGLKLGD